MDDYVAIHFCGGEYVCCDGLCDECAKRAFTMTDATSTTYAPETEQDQ